MTDIITRTLTVLPESHGNILCLQFSGIVTLADHIACCDRPLRDIVARYGAYRFLAFYKDFTGWTPEAADHNFKLINDICLNAERLAYVNPPERKILQLTLQRSFLTQEMRFFDENQLAEALRWIGE